MSEKRGYCIGCTEKLTHIDDDPNGEHNAECARCRAESEHDFDEEPNVVFDRFGQCHDTTTKGTVVPASFTIVYDPNILSADKYVKLVGMLGDLVRANGGEGLIRLSETILETVG
jgi:hypothetical protein